MSNLYKVLVVDDSVVIRSILARYLDKSPDIEIIGSVGNVNKALDILKNHPETDVVVLDIEMPHIDGLTALPYILELSPDIQVLMSSSLTVRNAEITMKALRLGAADYLTKPSSSGELIAAKDFQHDLIDRVHLLGMVSHKKREIKKAQDSLEPCSLFQGTSVVTTLKKYKDKAFTIRPFSPLQGKPSAICIGSSTGGPKALLKVIKDVGSIDQPIFITQHMPPNFTAILADHLSHESGVMVQEAQNGMIVHERNIYIAAGNYHMLIKKNNSDIVLHLTQDPPENFCRPAVDPMLRSAVEVYHNKLLAVILTGMGSDGQIGSEKVVESGGCVIAQDEASSVIWGMPGAVATAGLCSAVIGLDQIGHTIRQVAMGYGLV